MITLDGSHLEGGGALVRDAVALATATQQECTITNIRAGREQAGLKPQHLTAINALKEMCNAHTNDIALGSRELLFEPGKIKKGNYTFDIGTAGSISLLLQALLLPSLTAPGKISLTIKGGTCGKWQASVDYIQNVLFPQLQPFAEKLTLKIIRRGFYPTGGGEVLVEVKPKSSLSEIPPLQLQSQGELQQIKGIINVSSELAEKEVGERIKRSAEETLKQYRIPTTLSAEYVKASSIGGEIVLWANFSENSILGSSVLVEKGKTSEQIGKEAAELLIKEIKSHAAVDHYLADQLIPYMALLPGSVITASEISDHTKTNIYVAEKFLPVKFTIEGNIVRVENIAGK